jgi:hypothetical protein
MSGSEYMMSEDVPESADERHRISEREARSLAATSAPVIKTVKLPAPRDTVQYAASRVSLSEHHFDETLRRYGYNGVIDTAFRLSEDAAHPFHNGQEYNSWAGWRVIGTGLLGDVPLPILRALLDGTLDAKVKSNDHRYAELRDHFLDDNSYWKTRQLGDFAPIHYVRVFADGKGIRPTHKQLSLAMKALKAYASGDANHVQNCVKIDAQTHKSHTDADIIQQGGHHFFNGSKDRVKLLHMFIAAHEAYLATIAPEDRDKPIPDPLQYVGFTRTIAQRTKAHTYGDSSWLMTLFNAVCKCLFKEQNNTPTFWFETYVVAFPINQDECKVGEELFCRLCKSYCYNGLGFNIQPGGLSNVAPKLDGMTETYARNEWFQRLLLRNQSPVFEKQVIDEIEIYAPRWENVRNYVKRGDQAFRQDFIDETEKKIDKIEDNSWGKDAMHFKLKRLHEQNLQEESKIEDEDKKAAFAAVHRETEERIMAEIEAVRDTPPSEAGEASE